MRISASLIALLLLVVTAACGSATPPRDEALVAACTAEPEIKTTPSGVEFVRTPDACFQALTDWPFEPKYVEIDGLRQAYVDEGPAEGPVVLLLHGQPSWSYLYRKMIPILADGGYRVIAMDHLGMGRSDKPIDLEAYTFMVHYERLVAFVDQLELRDIHLFVQDWGSLIGLRLVGLQPDLFARVAIGNGMLSDFPAGEQPFPPVENPDEPATVSVPFKRIPAKQPAFYNGCEPRQEPNPESFGTWIKYAMTDPSFKASIVLEALTYFDLPGDVEYAYDAPFPSRIYMGGPRTFPSHINDLPGINEEAWQGLRAFEKPFLTLWASNDPGFQGSCEAQDLLINSIPGAEGLPHDRLDEASHFLQDDQGEEIATRLVTFFGLSKQSPLVRGDRYCEILIIRRQGLAAEAVVWGTQGLNDCPAEAWDSLDSEAIKSETGAEAVVLNGPRIWLPSRSTASRPSQDQRQFGGISMMQLAAIPITRDMIANRDMSQQSYVEREVKRNTVYIFAAGTELFQLTSPEGDVYVMQSLSQIENREASLSDLPTLGQQLTLPEGWSYQAQTLTEDLVLSVADTAIVLTDDLGNTYQKQ